jgi:hypothetical protein
MNFQAGNASKRLQRELREIVDLVMQGKSDGISAFPLRDNILIWMATIDGSWFFCPAQYDSCSLIRIVQVFREQFMMAYAFDWS